MTSTLILVPGARNEPSFRESVDLMVDRAMSATMRLAYQEIRRTMEDEDRIHDLRTAAYVGVF